ncbi:MAG TPA: hypothetical protein VMH33_04550 [Solirubrobacterales bacterium]|nr:hypothetical protein [Solirubrobacterales bacterium]
MLVMAEWTLHGPEAKDLLEQFSKVPTQALPVLATGAAGGWILAAMVEALPAIAGILIGMFVAAFLGSLVAPL